MNEKQDFFFFLLDNPVASSKRLRSKGKFSFEYVNREPEEIQRHTLNNLEWAKRILYELIFQAAMEGRILSEKLKTDKKRGLLDWM